VAIKQLPQFGHLLAEHGYLLFKRLAGLANPFEYLFTIVVNRL
jgi:hypothetical protein